MAMDRLVQLFTESMKLEDELGNVIAADSVPTDAQIETGVRAMEAVMHTEEAERVGADPSATFVLIGNALEERPHLGRAAARFYELALERRPGPGWERCVVLHLAGVAWMRQGELQEARRHLDECSTLYQDLDGHPRDEVLFGGSFSSRHTKREFAAMIEQFRTKLYHDLGDVFKARQIFNDYTRLSKPYSENVAQPQEEKGKGAVEEPAKALWRDAPSEERRITEYLFSDEGPCVHVVVNMNEHLGLGPDASKAVESLQQFRVKCEGNKVSVQLRLRHGGRLLHYDMLLCPLANDIIPEDTVPKLRGKPDKRRLELQLFKLEKERRWVGELVASGPLPKDGRAGKKAVGQASRGTMLNPLSNEEMAELQQPGGLPAAGERRRVNVSGPAGAPPTGAALPVAAADAAAGPEAAPRDTGPRAGAAGPTALAPGPALPRWVDELTTEGEASSLRILVKLSAAAGEDVGMHDLELNAGPGSASVRLLLLRDASAPPLDVNLPLGADANALTAKWKRRARTLELSLCCG